MQLDDRPTNLFSSLLLSFYGFLLEVACPSGREFGAIFRKTIRNAEKRPTPSACAV
jgi:hypothetical protein